MRRYAATVYRSQDTQHFGAFDPAKVAVMQDFYVKAGIMPRAEPVAAVYTDAFLPR